MFASKLSALARPNCGRRFRSAWFRSCASNLLIRTATQYLEGCKETFTLVDAANQSRLAPQAMVRRSSKNRERLCGSELLALIGPLGLVLFTAISGGISAYPAEWTRVFLGYRKELSPDFSTRTAESCDRLKGEIAAELLPSHWACWLASPNSKFEGMVRSSNLVNSQGRELVINVVNSAGVAISGARVVLDSHAVGEATNKDGACTILDASGASKLITVTADGYWVQTEPVPRLADRSVRIALKQINQLSIKVVSDSGVAMESLCVEVGGGESGAFEKRREDRAIESERVGLGRWMGISVHPEGAVTDQFALSTDGGLALRGLAAGVHLELRIIGLLGIVLSSEAVPPMSTDEMRDVSISLSMQPNTLMGKITDLNGHALGNARVKITTDECDLVGNDIVGSCEAQTDGAGNFRVASLFVNHVNVEVKCAGYVTVRSEAANIGDRRRIDVSLAPGKNLGVSVVDRTGRPMDPDQVWATFQKGKIESAPAARVGPGRYEIRDLPRGPVVVVLRIGGGRYELLHDMHLPDATFVLPDLGQIAVAWKLPNTLDLHEAYVCIKDKGARYPNVSRVELRVQLGKQVIEGLRPGVYEIGIERLGRGMAHEVLVEYKEAIVEPRSTTQVKF